MKSATLSGAHRGRETHYVDSALQKWLLVALVVLEIALVSISVWLLHGRLNLVIEANLYSVHIVSAASMLEQLRHEAYMVLALFVSANVIALLVADAIWHRYVYSVLRGFTTLLGKTSRLDFSADPKNGHHEVMILAATWRTRERNRLNAIRACVAHLDTEFANGRLPQSGQGTIREFTGLLPPAAEGN